MSKREPDDQDGLGYFMPEDSQHRLKKLWSHLDFLVQLAQPRTRDEEEEQEPTLYVGDVAVCLEQVAEQAGLVLDALSWSSKRSGRTRADRREARTSAAPESDAADARFSFGITLDQVDALDRLIGTIAAHGDVVATGRTHELADGTLPHLGQAIHDAATAMRAILDHVEAQRLKSDAGPGAEVRETRAVYGVAMLIGNGMEGPARVPAAGRLGVRRAPRRLRDQESVGIAISTH